MAEKESTPKKEVSKKAAVKAEKVVEPAVRRKPAMRMARPYQKVAKRSR